MQRRRQHRNCIYMLHPTRTHFNQRGLICWKRTYILCVGNECERRQYTTGALHIMPLYTNVYLYSSEDYDFFFVPFSCLVFRVRTNKNKTFRYMRRCLHIEILIDSNCVVVGFFSFCSSKGWFNRKFLTHAKEGWATNFIIMIDSFYILSTLLKCAIIFHFEKIVDN